MKGVRERDDLDIVLAELGDEGYPRKRASEGCSALPAYIPEWEKGMRP